MIYARIAGIGHYLPEQTLTNHDIEKKLDTSHEWIYSRSGISSRRVASAKETTAFMASAAAAEAIEASGLKPSQIDMVLVATCTPDSFFPSTACEVAHNLGIEQPIPAFDLSAACSGFLYALDVAKQFIMNKQAQHIIVVGAETMSKAVDWQDRGTCVLFGDGAGALVLSASDVPGLLETVLHAKYDEPRLLNYQNTVHLDKASSISMKGNEVFKMAVGIMSQVVDELLEKANRSKHDIQWLVPHQANIRIIQAIAKKLDMSMDQVVVTIEHQGNTSAASIPLALYEAVKSQKIKRGDMMLLEAFGGGMTWGATLIQY